MNLVEKYLAFVATQKRYSERTRFIYADVLDRFHAFSLDGGEHTDVAALQDGSIVSCLTPASVRAYQIHLMDERKVSARTVNLHLSVISSFCKYLIRQKALKSNPVTLVSRPKQSHRLPVFYKDEAMQRYLETDNALVRRDFELELSTEQERRDTYRLCLDRAIVCILYSTGIRRAELIGLRIRDVDFARGKMHVLGKGDKMREIPLLSCVINEISLYLHSVTRLVGGAPREADSPLLVTWNGTKLYPVLVDRAVKSELGALGSDFAGRKSPHVLRHTLATGLMEEGADLTSIKEVLGHANLAATQVYTHSSARALKKVYEQTHPRSGKTSGEVTKKR